MMWKKENIIEIIISNTLRIGVLLSASIIFAGLILFFIYGSGYDGTISYRLNDILNGVFTLKPFAIINLGLLLLILTPVMRVVMSLIIFILEKDYKYIFITLTVLTILMTSFILGVTE